MNSLIAGTIIYILGIVGARFGIEILLFILISIFMVYAVRKKMLFFKGAFIFCFIFMLGIINTNLQTKETDYLGKIKTANNITLQGKVASVPRLSLNKTRMKFYVDVEAIDKTEIKPSKTIAAINNEDGNFKNIKIGDDVILFGTLKEPSRAQNPSQFDYRNYLKNQNVFTVFYVKDDDYQIIHNPVFKFKNSFDENWRAILRNLDITRDKIIAKHEKYIKSPMLEVMGGIVFGNQAVNPPDDIKQTFINSGLLHLLAASGLNVGIIFFLCYFIMTKIGLGFRTKIITSGILIFLYTFMTGFPPSILRASVMILFVLLGKLIHRETNTLSLVFFVCFLILLFKPLMLMDVGFELSFLVTIGLVLCVEPIINLFKSNELEFQNKHQHVHPVLKKFIRFVSPAYLIGIVATPLVAQIWVIPLQMYYFNTITPYSIIANIFVLPFVSIISFLGFTSSILSLLPYVSDFILKITDFIALPFIKCFLAISEYFSKFPYSTINAPSPNIFQMIVYYLFIVLFFKSLNVRFKNLKLNIITAFCFILILLSFISIPNHNLEITAFSVGNADSFLIKTPNKHYIMIDTAKLPYRGTSSAKVIMGEYFKDNSIKNLDVLIVTHFDDDHAGGTIDILKSVKTNDVLIRENHCDTNTSCDILNYLKYEKIPNKVPKNGETVFDKDGVKIKTYFADFKNNKNENSIITLIEYKNKKFLFMGDAGYIAYENLKKLLPKDIDILKVGHHGASGSVSQNMLKELNPKYAIISTGLNTYGHPSPETIDELEILSIPYYSTFELGAIKFVVNEDINPYHYSKGKMVKLQ